MSRATFMSMMGSIRSTSAKARNPTLPMATMILAHRKRKKPRNRSPRPTSLHPLPLRSLRVMFPPLRSRRRVLPTQLSRMPALPLSVLRRTARMGLWTTAGTGRTGHTAETRVPLRLSLRLPPLATVCPTWAARQLRRAAECATSWCSASLRTSPRTISQRTSVRSETSPSCRCSLTCYLMIIKKIKLFGKGILVYNARR